MGFPTPIAGLMFLLLPESLQTLERYKEYKPLFLHDAFVSVLILLQMPHTVSDSTEAQNARSGLI
jgi:hypothetical protein